MLLEELSQLVAELNDNKIEYALCGGLALTIHGFPRATFDIDFLIRAESLEKAYKLAAEKGFDIRGLEMSFKESTVEIRRVSKIDDDGEVLPLDFLLVTPQMEDVWETRQQMIWQDKILWVVSRQGLIKMKTISGRAKDLIDIERIEHEGN